MKGVGLTTGLSSSHSDIEAQFIEKLKAGDADSFNTLVDRFGGHVYGLLLRITKDPEEAQDLTQETFLRALKGIKKFRGESGIRTWLFRDRDQSVPQSLSLVETPKKEQNGFD